MPYFLGIDGGGSKTAAVVGDETRELGRAVAGSCKIQQVGEAAARVALNAAITDACVAAGISARELARICIGVSGASNQEIAARVRQMIGEITSAPVEVVGDNVVALQAACGDEGGVVVIAGTGSIAYGRNERGEQARAGGFGPVISDEGSGTWIGKRAVYAVASEGAEQFALARYLMRAWNVSRISDLVLRANACPPPEFAALFPCVVQACEEHDEAACGVLREAGMELGRLALEVIAKLWPARDAPVRVGMAGGVLSHSRVVRQSFVKSVLEQRANVRINERIAAPALGALQIARHSKI